MSAERSWHERSFWSHRIVAKNAPNFPEGSRKIPQIPAKFPSKKSRKFTDELLQARRENVLQYKLEVYCGVFLSLRLRSQRGTALRMGGVLRYKLEVYCQYFLDKLYGLGGQREGGKPHKSKEGNLTNQGLLRGQT